MSIKMKKNETWLEKLTRSTCKYSPVSVDSVQTAEEMQNVVRTRVQTCQELASSRKGSTGNASWFGFLRDHLRERNLRAHNVPIIVLSGGKSASIKEALREHIHLAWHPKAARGEPVYLFVHASDYRTYTTTLSGELGQFRNLFVVGWDGGQLTGFGAARAAALAFADSLSYRPHRILMMDQDVLSTENTRHTNPALDLKVRDMHAPDGGPGRPVIGYGLGHPTRSATIPRFSDDKSHLGPVAVDSGGPTRNNMAPTQQFVSIMAPFRKRMDDGVYPAYMVAGGEDMLMSDRVGAFKKIDVTFPKKKKITVNQDLRMADIVKMDLGGNDSPNNYWNVDRVNTLAKLYVAENKTLVCIDGDHMTLADFCTHLIERKYIDPSERHVTSALIIERIILKAYKITDAWPPELDDTVLRTI